MRCKGTNCVSVVPREHHSSSSSSELSYSHFEAAAAVPPQCIVIGCLPGTEDFLSLDERMVKFKQGISFYKRLGFTDFVT